MIIRTLILTLYVVANLGLVQAIPEAVVSRTAYGVYFHPLGSVEVATDQWFHTFDIAIPKAKNLRRIAASPRSTRRVAHTTMPDNCSEDNKIFVAVNDLHQRAEMNINNLVKRIHATLRRGPSKRQKQRRPRRGFIDFIGDISHSLFGVARDSDIQAAEERVKSIFDRQQRILGQFEADVSSLASATSITNKRLDAIRSQMDTQEHILTDISRAVKLDYQTSLQLTLLLSETLYNFTCLEAHMQSLLMSLESLIAGRLEATLLHEDDIRRLLQQITKRLRNTKAPVRLLITDPSYFYRANTHLTFRRGNIICISLKIPITTLPQPFNLYKVTVTPKAISSDNQHTTLIANLPQYFAISADNQMYAIWQDLPSLQLGDSFRIINKVDIQLRTKQRECIMVLFLNDPNGVQELCETLLLNQKRSSFVYLTPNTLAIENSPSNFTLTCPTQQPSKIDACSSCLLSIPKACTLTTSGYVFPASCPQTSIIANNTHSMAHTFNLAILQEFFTPPDWENLKADTTVAQQITLRLPTFIAGTNSSGNVDKEDKLLAIDLSNAINAVKNGQVLFKSNADILQDQIDDLSNPSVTAHAIANTYAMPIGAIVTCLLTITNIYLIVKVHRLSAIVMALSRTTQATPMPPVWIFSEPTPITTTITKTAIQSLLSDETSFKVTVVTLLIFILIAWLSLSVWKRCSKMSPSHGVHLAINIMNANGSILVPWYNLRYAVADYEILALSDISHVHIPRRYLRPTLHFTWKITVLHNPSQMRITLPQAIRISPCMATRIRHVIGPHKRYNVSLNICGPDFNVPLALDVAHVTDYSPPTTTDVSSLLSPSLFPTFAAKKQ